MTRLAAPHIRNAAAHPLGEGASTTENAVSHGSSTHELASAIYAGKVQHRRHAPHAHAFSYRTAMLYLDLAELDRVFARRWLWSSRARNLAEFRRSDYLGDSRQSLDDAVRMRVADAIGRAPEGPIRLLTHLRYFGHSFNPVSFYYCFEADGKTLDVVVAEITNTPWKERHAYILPVATAEHHGISMSWHFAKAFHVSPFMAMQHDYRWRLIAPGKSLLIHMDVLDRSPDCRRRFDATLALTRQSITAANLARILLRFPLMTTRIVGAIHWQALRLWLRGNPVHDHPDNNKAA
ncbi:MAG: DUF1365 domain-containing protein [Dokdonella sp.]|uniref:DUF1365 domain-containing protein n=2 Tax=Dokdonella sp. TaxID=2291710 RepID=UPI002CAD3B89|nr:DUF1365 domain-containing protein [Dokdonella sp.]HOX70443.1 DUF1365 domain-containing protein [Dokdonella sp.]HPG95495.1 DUF1365 domain-containing protein [Dokdonella sp.]